ncbi:hypothetical protein [Candidatus Palauibacter sp.]|uniref:hypothetical protein n=1 Tax=Candidatus Palauibacter sp. TaxID=3101350 RepID=UPI003D0A0D39
MIAGLSLASAFTAGQQMDRFRSRRKQITEEEAADLVCESNYWSRLQRRSRVGAIQASIDSERYGFDPDPVDMQAEAISPPRHTADVDAILQQFWDDNPDARQDGLYRRDVLQAWLVEQAQQVTVTTRLSW